MNLKWASSMKKNYIYMNLSKRKNSDYLTQMGEFISGLSRANTVSEKLEVKAWDNQQDPRVPLK